MRDVIAVMDAAGSHAGVHRRHLRGRPDRARRSRAPIPNGSTSSCCTARSPACVWAPDYPVGVAPELAEPFLAWVEESWGNGEVHRHVLHHATPPTRGRRCGSMAKFERNACTPQMAVEILRRNLEIDVRALLPGIAVPTLVMHNAGDPLVPVGLGRYLAEHIAGRRVRGGGWRLPLHLGDEGVRAADGSGAGVPVRRGGRAAPGARRAPARRARSPPCCSPTSWAPPTWPWPWATSGGAACWVSTTGSRQRRPDGSAAASSRRRATGCWRSSTARPGRSTPSRTCARRSGDLDLQLRAGIHTGEIERPGRRRRDRRAHRRSGDGPRRSRRDPRQPNGPGAGRRVRHPVHRARGPRCSGVPGEWELYAVTT